MQHRYGDGSALTFEDVADLGGRYPLGEAADAVAALTDGSTSGRIASRYEGAAGPAEPATKAEAAPRTELTRAQALG